MKSASVSLPTKLQRTLSTVICALVGTLLIAPSAVAQYTPFGVFEGINPDGSSSFSFPADGSPITMMGIVLNNPANMLDSTPNFQPWNDGANIWNLGGQWQVFIQAYRDPSVPSNPGNSGDFGGCEVWLGQNYGNLPWRADSNDSYTNDAWTNRLAQVNYPAGPSQPPLQAGDVVAITGWGLDYQGMMNINEEHWISGYNFQVTRLETGMPLPAPTVTTLSQLMNSSGKFYFDPTHLTGAEHLQGTLVELNNVRLLSGTWAPNNQVVVTDGSLRQMILNLGNNPNLTTPPTGAFSVTGIEDQESTGSNQDGYALWVTDQANVNVQANSGGTFNWTSSGGSWNVGGNWSLGSKPQNAGDVALLGGSLAVPATVTLDGPQKVGSLILANSNSSTTGYTLSPGSGGTLTLDNFGATAFLTVSSGSHAITAPLALADNLAVDVAVGGSLSLSGGIIENSSGLSLTEDGGGLLILSGTNTYHGGTIVNSGMLILASSTALADGTSLTVGTNAASIFASATVTVPDSLVSSFAVNPVPEPGTLVLAVVAIVSCLFLGLARRRNHA